MRQVVLDIATTGLEHTQGHRIIEIACVELLDGRRSGRNYHCHINPQREIEQGAIEAHGITGEFLADKPAFENIAQEFVDFIAGAELIIHNAPFDVGFLDAELRRLSGQFQTLQSYCSVTDSLAMARGMRPGQSNTLASLCRDWGVDNSQQDLQQPLIDAEILADLFLLMKSQSTTQAMAAAAESVAQTADTVVSQRQICFDTETTGLYHKQGDRVIEIGCVELVNRKLTGRTFHKFINPAGKQIDQEAVNIHGITNDRLLNEPRFEEIADEFMAFVNGAELIAHNAPFDMGFLNMELGRLSGKYKALESYCTITDTRKMEGGKTSLDQLAKRHDVTNFDRSYHGALLDSEILAEVYLAMTRGTSDILAQDADDAAGGGIVVETVRRLSADRPALKVVAADEAELEQHGIRLDEIDKASGASLWRGAVAE